MKSWTLAAVTGLVGMVSVSSLGCAGLDDEREDADNQASNWVCARPTEGDPAAVARTWKTGNKIWQDDWLAPASSDCALQSAAATPSDDPR